MAQKTDIGVPRDSAADIYANPTVTDIGVAINSSLVVPFNMPQSPTNDRYGHGTPVFDNVTRKPGIGVPYNPQDGSTSN